MKKKRSAKKIVHFSFAERVKIETLICEGCSKRYIARALKRPESGVRYEINRNSVRGGYVATKAHFKAYQRRWRAKYQVLKIMTDKTLQEYVERHLRQYWSPEGISGRLKHIDTHLPYVGKDAIYAYVKSVHGRVLEQYLWYRMKQRKSAVARVGIPNRRMIDQRPKSVDSRRYFGDWEGDFIVSGKGGSGALLVLVERKSRFVIMRKLRDRTVSQVNATIASIFGSGSLAINSLTLDNDISFRRHEELSKMVGAPIFFCHPYHSWEKGQVEKMNQMIRRFVPKGTDISKIPDQKIREIERILNNRPLKCLGFRTPAEVVARVSKLREFVARVAASPYHCAH